MAARNLKNDIGTFEEHRYTTKEKEFFENEYYLDGNAVRKLQPEQDAYGLPKRRHQDEVERRREKRTRTITKPQKELSSVSKGACLVLILSIALTLIVCIDYINTQASLSILNKEIIQMEKDLTSLKDENKIGRDQLNAKLDLNRVYDVATTNYGMVRPNDDQVINFDSTVSDFVKQYKVIPKETQTNIANMIIK